MNQRLSISIIFACLFWPALCGAYSYQKTAELPPLKVTYDDVNQIFLSLRNQLLANPQPTQAGEVYEHIKITGGDLTIEKTGAFTFTKDDRLPEMAEDLIYSYSNRGGSVNEIYIFLHDSNRTITVSGTSPDHVDATYAFLVNKLSEKAITMGGRKFRNISAIFLFLIASALWNIPLWKKELPMFSRVALVICGIGIFISIFALPFNEWLPGFAIYTDTTSTIVKYSAEITFFGVILSIIFFIASIYLSFKLSKRGASDK